MEFRPRRKRPSCDDYPRRGLFNRPYHIAYIGLGANIRPDYNLPKAVGYLCRYTILEAVSSVWETPPDGLSGPDFLNAAVEIQTPVPAGVLKTLVLRPIEIQMGRIRTINKYASRPIDLDILIFNGEMYDRNIWRHSFLAVPLAELNPDYRNPTSQETLAEAATRLLRTTPIRPRPDIVLG